MDLKIIFDTPQDQNMASAVIDLLERSNQQFYQDADRRKFVRVSGEAPKTLTVIYGNNDVFGTLIDKGILRVNPRPEEMKNGQRGYRLEKNQ